MYGVSRATLCCAGLIAFYSILKTNPAIKIAVVKALSDMTLYASNGVSICAAKILASPIALPLLFEGTLLIAAVITMVVLVKLVQITVSLTYTHWWSTLRMRADRNNPNKTAQLRIFARKILTLPNHPNCRIRIQYLDEEGLDLDGLSKDFVSTILYQVAKQKHARSELTISKSSLGYDLIGMSQGPLSAENQALCQDMGILIGGICSRFSGTHTAAHLLGQFFRVRFYAGLIYLCEHSPLPKNWKTGLCITLAGATEEDPLFGLPLHQFSTCDSSQLQSAKAKLREWGNRAETEEDIRHYALERYESFCQPLYAAFQGFMQVRGACNMIRQFVTDQPLYIRAGLLSRQIQGQPFTREAFITMLRGDSKQQEVNWVSEWIKSLSTEDECRRLMQFVTGRDVIQPGESFTIVAGDVDGFLGRSCFNSLVVPRGLGKEEFISMLHTCLDIRHFALA